jgi:hypothetical protein
MGIFGNLQKTVDSPNGLKFAQSGHPYWDLNSFFGDTIQSRKVMTREMWPFMTLMMTLELGAQPFIGMYLLWTFRHGMVALVLQFYLYQAYFS